MPRPDENGDSSRVHADLIEVARVTAMEFGQVQTLAGAQNRDDSAGLLPYGSIAGYDVVREIHRGGQGIVYQAIQSATKRKVAIKIMRDGSWSGGQEQVRFEREAQILAQLNHPRIVRISDIGTAHGLPFFVMDYISGHALDVYVADAQCTIRQKLELFARVCDAVNAAHLLGVIHRDLKPSNIRIDSNGEPWILDFGLAKVAAWGADAAAPRAHTMTGQFVGSLPWASPEQAEGVPAKIDIRTDVYSLGVVLYQMLTGRFPYSIVGNMRDVLDNIMKAEPVHPRVIVREIDDEIQTIVLKCLDKARDRRYQSAGELARDIRRYLVGEPIEAKRDSGWYVIRKTMHRYKVPAAVIIGFLVLTMGFGVAMAMQSRRVAGERDRAEREAERAHAAVNILDALLSSNDWGGVRKEYALDLDRAVETCASEFASTPTLHALLRHAVATAYEGSGRLQQASDQAAAALDIRRAHLGPEHLDTLASLFLLGRVYAAQCRHYEAQALLRQAIEAERKRGLHDSWTLHQMNNRSVQLRVMGRSLEQSEGLIRETVALAQAFGADVDFTMWAKWNLAAVLCRQRKFEEAESIALPLFNECARRNQEKCPAGQLWLLVAIYNGWGKSETATQYRALLPPESNDSQVLTELGLAG